MMNRRNFLALLGASLAGCGEEDKDPMTRFLASVGRNDSLLACGDSISLDIFGASPSYSSDINALHPPYSPIVINNGIGGQQSTDAQPLLEGYIAANQHCAIVTLAWGTNDAYNQSITTAQYQTAMIANINLVLAYKRIPVIPTIPYSTRAELSHIPDYNAVITGTLYGISGVKQGPDLYTYIFNNQAYLAADGIHFTSAGYAAAAQQWANAMGWAYS